MSLELVVKSHAQDVLVANFVGTPPTATINHGLRTFAPIADYKNLSGETLTLDAVVVVNQNVIEITMASPVDGAIFVV